MAPFVHGRAAGGRGAPGRMARARAGGLVVRPLGVRRCAGAGRRRRGARRAGPGAVVPGRGGRVDRPAGADVRGLRRRRAVRRRRPGGRVGGPPAHDRRAHLGRTWVAGPLRARPGRGATVRRTGLDLGRAGPAGARRPGADRPRHPRRRGGARVRPWRSGGVRGQPARRGDGERRATGRRHATARRGDGRGSVRAGARRAHARLGLLQPGGRVHRRGGVGAGHGVVRARRDVRPDERGGAAARRLPDRACGRPHGERPLGGGRARAGVGDGDERAVHPGDECARDRLPRGAEGAAGEAAGGRGTARRAGGAPGHPAGARAPAPRRRPSSAGGHPPRARTAWQRGQRRHGERPADRSGGRPPRPG